MQPAARQVPREAWTPSAVERVRDRMPTEFATRLYWWACAIREEFGRPILSARTPALAARELKRRMPAFMTARAGLTQMLWGEAPPEVIRDVPELLDEAMAQVVPAASSRLSRARARKLGHALAMASEANNTLLSVLGSVPELHEDSGLLSALNEISWIAVSADALLTLTALVIDEEVEVRSPAVLNAIVDASFEFTLRHARAVNDGMVSLLGRWAAKPDGASSRAVGGFAIELEREAGSGRWIGEETSLGVHVYGPTRESAAVLVAALALRVLAERIVHGEATRADVARALGQSLG